MGRIIKRAIYEGTWHFDRFLRAKMDSFTINTTAACAFIFFKVSKPLYAEEVYRLEH